METRWEKSKHVFEKILEDSRKATERLIATLDELGEMTKARVERARIQRALFKRSAELGSRVFEISKTAPGDPTRKDLFDDGSITALLQDLAKLDEELRKLDAQISKD